MAPYTQKQYDLVRETNEINETDQTDQIDRIDQIDQTDQIDRIDQIDQILDTILFCDKMMTEWSATISTRRNFSD